MLVAGTAAAVGVALANQRRPEPVFAEVTPEPRGYAGSFSARVAALPLPNAREALNRRLVSAIMLGVGVLLLAALIPATTALISSFRSPPPSSPMFGPPVELRSASGIAGDWTRSYSDSAPSADHLGAAVVAGAKERQDIQVVGAMMQIADQQAAQQAASQEAASDVASATNGTAYSMGNASGYAIGTVLAARITIYGCTGPGGGYCNHMSSGGWPFEGAAACSSDLPFGTRLTIEGDPTGRTYECLDRGNLSATWIDVFFNDTSDGIAWQSNLGSTRTTIHIVN